MIYKHKPQLDSETEFQVYTLTYLPLHADLRSSKIDNFLGNVPLTKLVCM